MKKILFILCLYMSCLACTADKALQAEKKPTKALVFDKTKWNAKEGEEYLYRDQMLDEVVYNDTIRSLNKAEIIDLLGAPSYYGETKNFLYYRITEKRLGWWTLHTKTMVIKFLEDGSIEWIKIHE